jgi:hypothetical protein
LPPTDSLAAVKQKGRFPGIIQIGWGVRKPSIFSNTQFRGGFDQFAYSRGRKGFSADSEGKPLT